ncbi:MAG: transglutaminase-like domain-containing protein [Prolixibacteraceae bacterium]|nr:transglutaminase-like domain-containing protein [Prolixibacteraceae bacterium]
MKVLRNKKTEALLQLLDDPCPIVYEHVERELLKESTKIIPELETLWETSPEEQCQSRIENIIRRIYFKDNSAKLHKWSKRRNPALLDGFILASKYHYTDLNTERVLRKIDEIRRKVWIELNNSLTSLEKITVLNHIFFNDLGFKINIHNYFSPLNCFINNILETKMGNQVSIALLYAIVANKLDLDVRFVDIPHNPLLAYVDKRLAHRVNPHNLTTEVLFYINPSNEGSVAGRRELEFQLKRLKYNPEQRFFEASPPQRFLTRLLEITERSYAENGFLNKTEDIIQMINILNPGKID